MGIYIKSNINVRKTPTSRTTNLKLCKFPHVQLTRFRLVQRQSATVTGHTCAQSWHSPFNPCCFKLRISNAIFIRGEASLGWSFEAKSVTGTHQNEEKDRFGWRKRTREWTWIKRKFWWRGWRTKRSEDEEPRIKDVFSHLSRALPEKRAFDLLRPKIFFSRPPADNYFEINVLFPSQTSPG